ncbi:ATP-grasp domain-containing protein, partial [Parapusillimonas sp. SGNA-6]|nr:ATP-grasp domain-containing protein [Parapusillimonas sp. SGNA-6]
AIIEIAKQSGADAIHPGYGFLSENADLARRCAEENMTFIGPSPEVMERLGDKVSAKLVAQKANVPIIESSKKNLDMVSVALSEAERIGYPVMLKAAAGGGGRGMRVVRSEGELEVAYNSARSEAFNAFGNNTVFLEKYIENPRHIEVQVVGDHYGNVVHLYERDCSVQRRFQKVVEVAPSINLSKESRDRLYRYATSIATEAGYDNVGTVEFLVDSGGDVYFIEVNPRIQVEHTVTEIVTGVDLIKTQLYIASGYALGDPIVGLGDQESVLLKGYAIQCRITTEDPADGFKPDYGTLITYRNAAGFGVRLDEGSAYPGMKISPFFDSMLAKVSTYGNTLEEAARRMDRALREFRIRGVKNNIGFLENLIMHPIFLTGKATVGFIADHPELFQTVKKQDRGTKLLTFLGNVSVNGNPDVKGAAPLLSSAPAVPPAFNSRGPYAEGTKDRLARLGPEGFCKW